MCMLRPFSGLAFLTSRLDADDIVYELVLDDKASDANFSFKGMFDGENNFTLVRKRFFFIKLFYDDAALPVYYAWSCKI